MTTNAYDEVKYLTGFIEPGDLCEVVKPSMFCIGEPWNLSTTKLNQGVYVIYLGCRIDVSISADYPSYIQFYCLYGNTIIYNGVVNRTDRPMKENIKQLNELAKDHLRPVCEAP